MAGTRMNTVSKVGLAVGSIAFFCAMLTSFVIDDESPRLHEPPPSNEVTLRIESDIPGKVKGLFSKDETEKAEDKAASDDAEEGGRIKGFVDAVKDKFRGEDEAESVESTIADSDVVDSEDEAMADAGAPATDAAASEVAVPTPTTAPASTQSIDVRKAIPRLIIALGIGTIVLGVASRFQGSPRGIPGTIMALGVATVLVQIFFMYTLVVVTTVCIVIALFVLFLIFGGGF